MMMSTSTTSSTRSPTWTGCRSTTTDLPVNKRTNKSKCSYFLKVGVIVLSLLEVVTSRPWLPPGWGRHHHRHYWHHTHRRRLVYRRQPSQETLLSSRTRQSLNEFPSLALVFLSLRAGGESAVADVTNTSTRLNATSSSSSCTNDTTTTLPLWKQPFPEVLRKKKATFQKIRLGSTEIYLLGTAHVSNDSSKEVQVLLETVHPDAIFVELCEARIPLLTIPQQKPEDNSTTVGSVINNNNYTSSNCKTDKDEKKKESLWSRAASVQQQQGSCSRLQALSTVMLTSVQEEYAKDLGVELGGEFQAAYQYWKKQRKQQQQQQQHLDDKGNRPSPPPPPPPHFVLGDRPMHLTLRRAWESLWWWPKTKVVAGLLWSCMMPSNTEEIRAWLQQVLQEESDILSKSFEEMRQHFPTLYHVIIRERDAYLAAKLTQTCRALTPGSVVVAIVGAGHVPGICQWLVSTNATQTPEQVLAELVTTKKQKKNKVQEEDPEQLLVYDWIHQVTTLHDMPDETFVWAQQQEAPSPVGGDLMVVF